MSSGAKPAQLPTSPEESLRWVQRIHGVQSKRTPEALEAARQRIERARQTETSYRKCRAVKSHAVRSRALAAEGLRQMSEPLTPALHMAVHERWKSAQEASSRQQTLSWSRADQAVSSNGAEPSVTALEGLEEEEEQAMQEVAELVGAADMQSMAAIGSEGLISHLGGGEEPPSGHPGAAGKNSMEALLAQLQHEPKDAAECAAKFMLYEGYGAEVEQMRSSLLKFYRESCSTVPDAVAADMGKKVGGIDSQEAMGIPDDPRKWFVYHMMRQAERNNLKMAAVLGGFEKKLEFLAANDQIECPVCLEPFQEQGEHAPEILSCCHKVCKNCWANWSAMMHGRPFCPLCRHEAFLGTLAVRVNPGIASPSVDEDDP